MTTTTTLRAKDLSCPSCIAKIEGALQHTEGVKAAEVKFNTGKIVVKHDPAVATTEQLIAAVRSAGYEATKSAF